MAKLLVKLGTALLLGLLCISSNAAAEGLRTPDIRVLIDVSGSMRQSDPRNLRGPALRMLSRLLPTDSIAGVWTYGDQPEILVPLGFVDGEWVQSVSEASRHIHSRAQFSNLGEVLTKAMVSWYEKDDSMNRNIILLTDGLVDVAVHPDHNEEARRQVITELLPLLKSKGVHIHTVALSHQADAELLEKLAVETDGLFQKIVRADDLQQVFLNILDQAAAHDTLPLDNNTFMVDESIEEITLLIFNENRDAKTKLVTPGMDVYTVDRKPDDVQWHEEGNVDLITIRTPRIGKWRILADIDPNNRVMAVSKMTLDVSELPSNLFIGERLTAKVKLIENDKVITEPNLLKLLDFYADWDAHEDGIRRYPMKDDGKKPDELPKDGIYSVRIGPLEPQATQFVGTLQLVAKANTFARQRQHSIRILPLPVDIKTKTIITKKGKPAVIISMTGDLNLIKADNLYAKAKITTSKGDTRDYDINQMGDNVWRLRLDPAVDINHYNTEFLITGETVAGRRFTLNIPPMMILIPQLEPGSMPRLSLEMDDEPAVKQRVRKPVEPKPQQPQPQPVPEPEPVPEPMPASKPEPVEQTENPRSSGGLLGAPKPTAEKETTPVSVTKPEPKPEPKPETKPEPKPEPKSEPKPEPKPEPKQESKPESEQAAEPEATDEQVEEKSDVSEEEQVSKVQKKSNTKLIVSIIVIGFNLLLIIGGILGYLIYRKKKEGEANEADALDEED